MKACRKCGEEKPLDSFYANENGTHGRMPYCKKCDNARPRKTTAVKVNRTRARHRAVADLIATHADEFATLLAIRMAEASEEAEELAKSPRAGEHYSDEPVRLVPGRRMAGEKASDRIDVARCPYCVKHHDRGHVCAKCGTAPYAALRIPDDDDVDEIALERAMTGDAVRLTVRERTEVVRRLAGRGYSDNDIATRLHVNIKTVERCRKRNGIEARWTG